MAHVVCSSSHDDLATTRALLSEHIPGTTIESLVPAEFTRGSLHEQAIRLLDALLRLGSL